MTLREPGTGPMIAVDGLVVSFGDDDEVKRAVDGIGFQVREGETFGLVGESGCGKSTVLRVLAGLNPTYAGRLRIAGRDIGPNCAVPSMSAGGAVEDPLPSICTFTSG